MKHYVYKISNIIEDKHYIGARSAKNPNKDLGIKYFSSSTDKEFMLEQQEFPERFEYKILEVLPTRKLAVAKEIELHDLYDVAVNESFYNKAKQKTTGFCVLGATFNHTEETKEKMSATRRGKPKSEETKDKISAARRGNTHSQETKEKMSAALRGKPKSEDHKRKLKEARNELSIKTAYSFIVHDSNNKVVHDEVVINFDKFCLRNKYPAVSFRESHRTNEPIKSGKFKGWRVVKFKK